MRNVAVSHILLLSSVCARYANSDILPIFARPTMLTRREVGQFSAHLPRPAALFFAMIRC